MAESHDAPSLPAEIPTVRHRPQQVFNLTLIQPYTVRLNVAQETTCVSLFLPS